MTDAKLPSVSKPRGNRGAPGGAELTRTSVRPADTHAGDSVLIVNVIATSMFVVSAVAASIFRNAVVGGTAVVIAVTMFFGGAALMAISVVLAATKSRTHHVDIVNLFFATRRAAALRPQVILMSALTIQIIAGIATAAIRPNSTVALGTLSWLAGLGFNGIWSAKHGTFSPRDQ